MPIKEAPVQVADDQNYDVEIDKIYQNFIIEIDKIRSHVSVQDNPSLSVVITANVSQAPTNITVEQTPQESRCHAFYRLLGFPITDGTDLYSPGFDKLNNSDLNKTSVKNKIAINLFNIPKIKDLLDSRENDPRKFLSLFSVQDVDAMVLGMSLQDIRSLTSLSKVSGALDSDLSHQSYVNDLGNRLKNTVINNNNHATSPMIGNRRHILAPFIVDPRIDESITPKRNRLAVPFLADKSETKLTDNIYLKRPYIEKVCRDRLDTTPKITTLGQRTIDIINSIKSNDFISGNAIIQKAFDPNNITANTIQFANYFNAIRSVLCKLYESVRKVSLVLAADPKSNGQAHFNWTPIPNKFGPEKGSTTRDLITGQSSDPSNTPNDSQIINLLYTQGLNNISNKITTLQTADLGGFAFDGTELTPDQNSSDSFGDQIQSPITMYQNMRKDETDDANEAIRIIEIIMGEYSGLGLLDILVISSAFWVSDIKDILGMLDDTAIDRMLVVPNLQAAEVKARKTNGANVSDSLQNYQNKVKEIYDVCDQLYLQIKSENRK